MRNRPVTVKFAAHNRQTVDYPSYNIKDLPPAEQERITGLFRKVKPKEHRRMKR